MMLVGENKKNKMAKENLRQKIVRYAGSVGVSLASLVGGGCVVTPADVENFLDTGSFKGTQERQWVEIDGRMGFINSQGYGIVPNPNDCGKTIYLYEYKNGEWRASTRHGRFDPNTYKMYFRD